jgi:hypothetical protein
MTPTWCLIDNVRIISYEVNVYEVHKSITKYSEIGKKSGAYAARDKKAPKNANKSFQG